MYFLDCTEYFCVLQEKTGVRFRTPVPAFWEITDPFLP